MARPIFACGLAVALVAAPGGWARAAALTVSPPRIELSVKRPIATLEVRNDGAETVTLQLDDVVWTQAEGVDRYSASADLVATPTVFELAPHVNQVLRIGLRDGHAPVNERAYRVYICEVATEQQPKTSGLKMLLRIGVPIFVSTSLNTQRLNGEINRQQDGSPSLLVRNAGGHVAHAIAVDVSDAAGTMVWQTRVPAYVLAGGEHAWSLPDSMKRLTADDPLHVSVTTETGVEHIDARLIR